VASITTFLASKERVMGTMTVGMVVVEDFEGSLPARVKMFWPEVWVKVGTVPCARAAGRGLRRGAGRGV
jgi:hypothetical protein